MSQRDAKLIGGVYRVGQVIATAGLLTTCTAHNRNTNDVVGLFIVDVPPIFHDAMAQQLLQPLARRQAVRSQHVLSIHDWGIDGSHVYIATDPPRGITLRYVLDNENIDLQRILELSRQIVLGVKALHEQGIVGVDLRPQLITIDTIGIADRVQLDDVGLRVLLSGFGGMNAQQNNDISSLDPRYAPPEYITGGHVGPWSDIYQVGLLLFEMTTGRLPFVGHNPAETGIMQSTNPPPRMDAFKYDAPFALQQIVDGTLSKNPSERFSSADALLRALEDFQPARPLSRPLQTPQGNINATPGLTTEMPSLPQNTTIQASRAIGVSKTNMPVHNIPSPEGVYAYLCLEQEGVETRRLVITQANAVVGRTDPKRSLSPDVDISQLDPRMTVSRQHARIRFEGTFFYLEDLKSRNKTRLNDRILTPLQADLLQHGDLIRFGSVQLIFRVASVIETHEAKSKK